MKYLSLFSGIGGFELGIQQAYELHNSEIARLEEKQNAPSIQKLQSDNQSRDGRQFPTCIGYSETDRYAIQIYEKHFPNHTNYGDITKINATELPDFDLLCGGFPCQAFSIAGKRKGFDDTRGTLFFDIARILKEKHPRLLLLENVKGLLSHDNGNTFKTIISTLDELGYDLQWQVLNSKNFGVPQNRERVFIVGHLRGEPRPQVFPIRGSYKEVDSYEWEKDKPRMLSEHRTELGKKTRKEIRQKEGRDSTLRGKEHKEYRPNSHELANCLTTGKQNIEKWVILQKNKKKQKISLKSSQEKMGEIQHFEKLQRDSSYPQNQVYGKDLTELKEGRRNVPIAIRRLTPTECERLQGFPDGWTEGVSDTQRYKTLGNAVTVNVVRELITNMIQ